VPKAKVEAKKKWAVAIQVDSLKEKILLREIEKSLGVHAAMARNGNAWMDDEFRFPMDKFLCTNMRVYIRMLQMPSCELLFSLEFPSQSSCMSF
jgi:hypothetical protein